MRESTAWYLFLFAGLIIFVLLGLHMAIMHLDELLLALGTGYSNVLTFGSVLARSKQTFFMISYIILLAAALYHGLYGLRTILLELNFTRRLQQFITGAILVAGVGLFVFGTYVAIATYLLKTVN